MKLIIGVLATITSVISTIVVVGGSAVVAVAIIIYEKITGKEFGNDAS